MTFSENLQELGLRAVGTTCTGLNTVYFTGDAPEITDDPVLRKPDGDTVFPDGTTTVYYPIGNSTWNGYEFWKLSKYAQFIGYDPANKPESTAEVQTSGDTVEYYTTVLNPRAEDSGMPGTRDVTLDGDLITFYSSFYKREGDPSAEAEFIPYGEVTFEIAEDMKSCYYECDEDVWGSKEGGINSCLRLDGLICTLKVVNGKIEEMLFNS